MKIMELMLFFNKYLTYCISTAVELHGYGVYFAVRVYSRATFITTTSRKALTVLLFQIKLHRTCFWKQINQYQKDQAVKL